MTPKEIAGRLKSDESKILRMMEPDRRHRVSTLYPTLQSLRRKELVIVIVGVDGLWARITDLGLAVRRALEGKNENG